MGAGPLTVGMFSTESVSGAILITTDLSMSGGDVACSTRTGVVFWARRLDRLRVFLSGITLGTVGSTAVATGAVRLRLRLDDVLTSVAS